MIRKDSTKHCDKSRPGRENPYGGFTVTQHNLTRGLNACTDNYAGKEHSTRKHDQIHTFFYFCPQESSQKSTDDDDNIKNVYGYK